MKGKKMQYSDSLRAQAARCLRAAAASPDAEFAQELTKIAQELRAEADQYEASVADHAVAA